MAHLKMWLLLAGTHLAAGITGWCLRPTEILDSEVEYTGLGSVDVKRTLAAAVLSLREENKLLSYTYRGAAHVAVERSDLFGLLKGAQKLTVPATVSYYVNLRELGLDDLHWNEASKLLKVNLPPIALGEVAFEAEAAVVESAGLLTYSDRQVQELARANYRTARRAFIKQAQEHTLVAAAERRARENVARHFGTALAATGRSDVRVVATFRDD